MPATTIDLNCDLGEGIGPDAELMPWITSASVAGGFHAGGPGIAATTLRLSAQAGVCVGAHPGFADRDHFGRRELAVDESQLFAETVYQVGALHGLARAVGTGLTHVKPHGALYHLAARSDDQARPLIAAARLFGLAVVGPPGSRLKALCGGSCRFVAEGFADRRYQADGTLVPRGAADALILDAEEAAEQVVQLVRDVGIETVCVHGDTPGVVEFVIGLRQALARRDIVIQPFTSTAASP